MTENPYVGLRPFQQDESLLFFGRRQQIAELMDRLHDTRFLGIVGSSGCGKSSLIRAGLMPRLEAGFLVENRDRWFFATMTPGSEPLDRLAACFNLPVTAIEEEGAFAITAHLAAADASGDRNCFILVDQFEELFRFAAVNRDQAADFVQILLSLVSQRDFPVFVAITMRSDFLGECDAFTGLPEALNRSQYFVPRLNRQQRREAVEGPVKLFRQTMTPQLLDRLINDVGDEPGQLPVLQHALLRTWEQWTAQGAGGPLDLHHYEAIGGIKEALSRDAEAALRPESTALAERVFRRLTTTDGANRRVRRPALISELEAVTGASRAQIREVLEPFHRRSFVVIYDRPGGDHLIDISHESLIAQWDRLKQWVDAEAESKRVYLDLVTAVERKKALLHDADLQVALDWRKKLDPSTEQAWATDLNPAYPRVVAYIDASVKEDQQEQRRRVRQLWLMWGLGAALLLVSVPLLWVAYTQLNTAKAASADAARAMEAVERARLVAQESQRQAAEAGRVAYESRQAATEFEKQAKTTLAQAEVDAREALSVRLGGEAQRIEITTKRPDDNQRRAMLSAHALRLTPTFEALSALLEVLVKLPRHPKHLPLPGSAPATLVVFSPDRKHLASGHQDGKVYLWNIEAGKVERELGRALGGVHALAFDGKGEWLAAGAQGGITVFSTTSAGHSTIRTPNVARSVAIHPDGHVLAAIVQASATNIYTRTPSSAEWTPDTITGQNANRVFFDAYGVLFLRSVGSSLPLPGINTWKSGSSRPNLWLEGSTLGNSIDPPSIDNWFGSLERGAAKNPVDRIVAAPAKPHGIKVWDGRLEAFADPISVGQEVKDIRAVPGKRSFVVEDKQGTLVLIDAVTSTTRRLPSSSKVSGWALHPSPPLVALGYGNGSGEVINLETLKAVWRWSEAGEGEVAFNTGSDRLYIEQRTGPESQSVRIVAVDGWKDTGSVRLQPRDVVGIDALGRRLAIEHRDRPTRGPPDRITILDARTGILIESLRNPTSDAVQLMWPRLFSRPERRATDWYMDGDRTVVNPVLTNGRVVDLPANETPTASAITDDHSWAATGAGATVYLWPLDPADVLDRACKHYLDRNLSAEEHRQFRIPEKFRTPACPNLKAQP